METPPTHRQPLTFDTTTQDDTQMKIVVILEYVYAGFVSLGVCVGILYIFFGLAFGAGMIDTQNDPNPPPEWFDEFFYYLGIGITLISVILLILVLLSAWHMSKRKHRTFSFIVAAICCLNIPLGTALGVYTIIVLLRPGVIAQYQQATLGGS